MPTLGEIGIALAIGIVVAPFVFHLISGGLMKGGAKSSLKKWFIANAVMSAIFFAASAVVMFFITADSGEFTSGRMRRGEMKLIGLAPICWAVGSYNLITNYFEQEEANQILVMAVWAVINGGLLFFVHSAG